MKRLIEPGVVALALATAVGCAARGYARFAPPPPPPPPREAMMYRPQGALVWVPGYYRWDGHRYKWVRGRWVKPPRHGAVWVPGYWAERPGGRVWIEGYWR